MDYEAITLSGIQQKIMITRNLNVSDLYKNRDLEENAPQASYSIIFPRDFLKQLIPFAWTSLDFGLNHLLWQFLLPCVYVSFVCCVCLM